MPFLYVDGTWPTLDLWLCDVRHVNRSDDSKTWLGLEGKHPAELSNGYQILVWENCWVCTSFVGRVEKDVYTIIPKKNNANAE